MSKFVKLKSQPEDVIVYEITYYTVYIDNKPHDVKTYNPYRAETLLRRHERLGDVPEQYLNEAIAKINS